MQTTSLQRSMRKFRENTCQPFKDFEFEDGVVVFPSGVKGLGVYTTRSFKKGEVMCYYSGECVKCIKGNNSPYLIEFHSPKHGIWYLDSCESGFRVVSACGRYINDPCSSYDLKKYPWIAKSAIITKFTVNCRYETKMYGPHPDIGEYYTKVIALHDLDAGVELFVEYGIEYWKRRLRYFKGHDNEIKLNSTYYDGMWLKNKIL